MIFNNNFLIGLIPFLFFGLSLMCIFTIVDMLIWPIVYYRDKAPYDSRPRSFYIKGLLAITFLTLALVLDYIRAIAG